MNEIDASLYLFANIEGGHGFWSNQVSELGPLLVYERLLSGKYDRVKYEKLITNLRATKLEEIKESIAKTGSIFLTPQSPDWPASLNDLSTTPIGLVVKGDLSVLSERSLAIVGTRNPTPYGLRIAGDFAAGFVDREWSIVSGGAYGIDSAAHKGALIAEGRTIAVLAAAVVVA